MTDHQRRTTSPSVQQADPAPAVALPVPMGPAAVLALQRSAGNRAVCGILSRQPQDPDATAGLPGPVGVEWGGDRFEVSFSRVDDTLRFAVRYAGSHPTKGRDVAAGMVKLDMPITPLALAAKVVRNDATSLELDLYGDARRRVRIVDETSFDGRADSHGRRHQLRAVGDGRSPAVATLWVLDPKATIDNTRSAAEDLAGTNPSFGLRAGAWEAEVDGDGDGQKELSLKLRAAETYPDPSFKDVVKTLEVVGIQRSTGEQRRVTLAVPRSPDGGRLLPLIRDVTDGRAPTRISLVRPDDTQFLDIAPATMTMQHARYRLSLNGASADLIFPPDVARQRYVATPVGRLEAGSIVAWDVALGAYGDRFRLTVRALDARRYAFGVSAIYGTAQTGGAFGVEVVLPGPYNPSLLTTEATNVGIDLDGDGKADLQVFDRLTTRAGGTPDRARDHRIRVVGMGADRTYDFHYQPGGMTGGVGAPTPADLEADRNSKAVAILAGQEAQGGALNLLAEAEMPLMAIRKRAADKGMIDAKAFAAWRTLSEAMIKLEPQMTGQSVDVPTAARAAGAATALEDALNAAATWTDMPWQGKRRNEFTGAEDKLTDPVTHTGGHGYKTAVALRAARWADALVEYRALVTGLDRWIVAQLDKAKSKDVTEARFLASAEQALGEVAMHKDAIRIAAVYHPDQRFHAEQGYTNAIPLNMFAWREGNQWTLRDITNPAEPFEYHATARAGETGPPPQLFLQLDDPDHFPEGQISWVVPNGPAGRTGVRDKLTWKKFLTWAGVVLGIIGAGLALVASAGAASVAVPAAYALTASAIAGATAAGIDLVERIQQGKLTVRTALIDITQIVGGLATAGAVAGGRLVAAAASAPAGARLAGAWAEAALLAQRYQVPLTITAAGADLLQVVLVAEATAHELDEIAARGGDPEQIRRARLLLLTQMAVMGGMGVMNLSGALGSQGRQLVLSPGPDGVPVASAAVARDTLLVDANVAIALRKRAAGEPLNTAEQAAVRQADAHAGGDLRVADRAWAEASVKGGGSRLPGFGVGVDRSSAEYKALMAELKAANVGGDSGSSDRQIVADAFFAMTEKGVTPKFATMDEGFYKRLYDIRIKKTGEPTLMKLGTSLPKKYGSAGFEVEINGRKLTVVALSNV